MSEQTETPDSTDGAYQGSLEQRWRYAEANVAMLTDALVELFDFVTGHLDPHPMEYVDQYLGWGAERRAQLRVFLLEAGRAECTRAERDVTINAEDMVQCEGCPTLLDPETCHYDVEMCPLCDECYAALEGQGAEGTHHE